MIDYLNPRCRPSTLDNCVNVLLILRAVRRALKQFSGTVLDVGCGTMPYRGLIQSSAGGGVTRYIGLDLHNDVYRPDVAWDGRTIPLRSGSADAVIMTEVLEHCPDPAQTLAEVNRVLAPGGVLFLTVPFIWPIHSVPHDEFRYTPFALRRLLERAGFSQLRIEATGGRHAVLAITLGLWIRRRPLTSRRHVLSKSVLSFLLWPTIWLLQKIDRQPPAFDESTMIVGLSASAFKVA